MSTAAVGAPLPAVRPPFDRQPVLVIAYLAGSIPLLADEHQAVRDALAAGRVPMPHVAFGWRCGDGPRDIAWWGRCRGDTPAADRLLWRAAKVFGRTLRIQDERVRLVAPPAAPREVTS